MKKKVLFSGILLAFQVLLGHAQQRLLGEIFLCSPLTRRQELYIEMQLESRLLPLTFQGTRLECRSCTAFVEPSKASAEHKGEGVCQDLDYVTKFGQRIKDMGYQFMLDFHYSDTWADPGKQFIPDRWLDAETASLPDSVYRYTKNTLRSMVEVGACPDLIQVGNEITNGMMWYAAKVDPLGSDNWDLLVRLLESGARACREVCPKAKIIIHTEKAGEWNKTKYTTIVCSSLIMILSDSVIILCGTRRWGYLPPRSILWQSTFRIRR